MEKPVVVIGTGGHARVVAEILRAAGQQCAGFVLPPGASLGSRSDLPEVFLWEEVICRAGQYRAVVAVGDNALRQKYCEAAAKAGFSVTPAVHPSAVIGSGASVGEGTVIGPGAVLTVNVSLGSGVIVNTGASVDHDCRIGDFAHLAPGSVLCGSVAVGERVLIGAGAVVINNVKIGADTTVGAGAVVVRDLPAQVVATGVPARTLRDVEL